MNKNALERTSSIFEKTRVRDFFVQYGAIAVLFVLILFNMIFTKNFASLNTFFLIIKQVAGPLYVAVGMTIIISLGGIDISVGSTMAIAGVVIAKGMASGKENFLFWFLVAVVVCAFIGSFNGYLVGKYKVQPIILTLVMQIILRGIAVLIAESSVFSMGKYEIINKLGLYKIGERVPIQLVFFVLISVISVFSLKKTSFGKYVEAIGENTRAAKLSGINTVRITILAYMISAILAGICGVLEMCRTSAVDPNELGTMFDLDAIAAVAVGGTSMKGGKANIIGSLAGAIIMVVIGITVNMNNIPFAFSNIIKAVIIIFALAIQRERSV